MAKRAEKEAKRIAEEAKKAKLREKERAKADGKPKGPEKAYPPAEFIRETLEKFYTANAPEKLGNLDKIMEKFAGKWPKLEAGLAKKFPGKAPDLCALYAASRK
mmetsp:Transcript_3288/g.6133  ORF Transcript_3288/g.6133 Transcript_3288/m.6133 type:complete len:104 (+) Transcript_3288:291-602(+)